MASTENLYLKWCVCVYEKINRAHLERFEDMGTETVQVFQSFPQNLSRWLT